MTLINVFAFSAAMMALMLSFKVLENKLGRDIISRNFREALDDLVIDTWKIIVDRFQKTKKKVFHELKKIPIFILHILIGFWGFALRKTLKAVSLIQGRSDGSAKGYVSDHLRAVDAYKEHLIEKERE